MLSVPTTNFGNAAATAAQLAAPGVIVAPKSSSDSVQIVPITRRLFLARVLLTAAGTPGSIVEQGVVGDFIRADSVTDGALLVQQAVDVIVDGVGEIPLRTRQRVRYEEPFSKVTFKNVTAGAIVAVFQIGFGEFADENTGGAAGGTQVVAPAGQTLNSTLQRPAGALAYAAGQIIGGNGIGPVIFNQPTRAAMQMGTITGARCTKNSAVTLNAWIRLHLYGVQPAGLLALADGAPFTLLFANAVDYMGVIDFPLFITEGAGSDCAVCDRADFRLDFAFKGSGAGTAAAMFGFPVAEAAYAAIGSEQFRFDLNLRYW